MVSHELGEYEEHTMTASISASSNSLIRGRQKRSGACQNSACADEAGLPKEKVFLYSAGACGCGAGLCAVHRQRCPQI